MITKKMACLFFLCVFGCREKDFIEPHTPLGCVKSSDCPIGYGCSLGECKEGFFPDTPLCACSDLQTCQQQEPFSCVSEVSACVEPYLCMTDADCNSSRRCDVGKCRCSQNEKICEENQECPRGLKCSLEGDCVEQSPCQNDDGCDAHRSCVSGACVDGPKICSSKPLFFDKGNGVQVRDVFCAEENVKTWFLEDKNFEKTHQYVLIRVQIFPSSRSGSLKVQGCPGSNGYKTFDQNGKMTMVCPVSSLVRNFSLTINKELIFEEHMDVHIDYSYVYKNICMEDVYETPQRNDGFENAALISNIEIGEKEIVLCGFDEDWFFYDHIFEEKEKLNIKINSEYKKIFLDIYENDDSNAFIKGWVLEQKNILLPLDDLEGGGPYYFRFYKEPYTPYLKATFTF
jgi:hypothetical protein